MFKNSASGSVYTTGAGASVTLKDNGLGHLFCVLGVGNNRWLRLI